MFKLIFAHPFPNYFRHLHDVIKVTFLLKSDLKFSLSYPGYWYISTSFIKLLHNFYEGIFISILYKV